ncbi:unnamed protein product [Dovyalis caffra]|uniref:Pectinesterase inhibitor domain-containing protein n=1 Tax=Dovyalis caffra TaxID=77055 RepID=A0AAV1SD32_9ROSI|nr:unnamed protein product [Dovyalis caffra]
MELNKSVFLLLVFSSLLSFFAEAICVPRNVSNGRANPDATERDFSLGPALSLSSSAPTTQAPLPPPASASSPSPSASSPLPLDSPPDSQTQSPSILRSPFKNAALTKICGMTDYPAKCIAAISPFLTGETDPISILKIGMQALHKKIEEAIAVATKLNEDPSSSAVVKDSLDTCLDSFDNAISDLNDALLAISSHDIGKLSTMLSATITYPDTCEEAFAEQPDLASPMKEMDDQLTKIGLVFRIFNTIESPLPSPFSSQETESSPLPSQVSSTQPVPSPPDSPTNAPPTLPYSPSVNHAVLSKICGVTRFQAECLATIAPYQTGATDPISVIKMGIQALHKDLEEARATATKLSQDTSLSAMIRDSFDICVESYDAAISDLHDALTAISSHDMDRLTRMLGAVASYPEICQDAFLEQGKESPLKAVDLKLDKLASIAVDMTILLPVVKIIE